MCTFSIHMRVTVVMMRIVADHVIHSIITMHAYISKDLNNIFFFSALIPEIFNSMCIKFDAQSFNPTNIT